MRAFGTEELERLQGTQEGAMQDTCLVLVYVSMTDKYGLPKPVYGDGYEVACGLELVRPNERQGRGEVPVIEARLRLAWDSVIDERDRVKVTHRFGVELASPQTFEIVGPVVRGPSGLVLNLRVVTDGSD